MFDDFRQQAGQSDLEQEDENQGILPPPLPRRTNRILGMTPPQRFLIAAMLLLMTCLLSTLCLLVTEKVFPPI
jgi:hypothetical protein